VPEIEKAFKQAGISDVFFISAATGEGVRELIAETWRRLETLLTAGGEKKEALKVFQPQPRGANLTVRKEDGTFIIEAPGLDRLVSGTGDVTPELLAHVKERLSKAGLEKLLQKGGVKPGDKIRCGYVEWEWTPWESSNH
jgi:GTP-binding protein